MNKIKEILILGIDTSCDETSVALLSSDKVISNVISSQVALHQEFGGVVPMIAKREHESRIDLVVNEALKRGSIQLKHKISFQDLDAVAVTYGPGLAIALEVGIKKAKEIAIGHNIKLIGVNHMEGHLLSSLALNSKGKGQISFRNLKFPVLALLISGGHTQLILMQKIGEYQLLGETLDDAVGEAYDKTARMLGLGYPGGEVLTKFAKLGVKSVYDFPVPMAKDPSLNFSFSGLKTAIFYKIKNMTKEGKVLSKKQVCDISAGFELSAITQLQIKMQKAVKLYQPKTILVGGGVSSSAKVRMGLRKIAGKFNVPIFFPRSHNLATDNGAMIALAGLFKYKRNELSDQKLDRDPNASITFH
jgi:N6-L-threonylcarbamoyladenine synthase